MNKDTYITILQDIIQIESVNNNEKEVANYIKNFLEGYNIKSDLVYFDKNRSALTAEIENGPGKTLALSGHLDVVSAGDKSAWSYPPFAGEIVDGKMHGRGTADMKSGVAAMLFSFIEKSQTKDFKGKIRLIFTVGEESGGIGAKQLSDLGYVHDVDALLIGEPTRNRIIYAHKGFMNYTVRSTGKSVHSSMPDTGINAINQLLPVMEEINKKFASLKKEQENEVLGRTEHSITIIHGGDQQNTVPDYAEFRGNIRVIPEFDNPKIVDTLTEIVNKFNTENLLELEIEASLFPVEADENSSLIQAIQSQLPEKVELDSMNGGTDAGLFFRANPDMDVAIFGPGDASVIHQVNEYIELNDYLEYIRYYKDSISAYLV